MVGALLPLPSGAVRASRRQPIVAAATEYRSGFGGCPP